MNKIKKGKEIKVNQLKTIKGTVATKTDGKTAFVNYKDVLNCYATTWGNVPKTFGDRRAMELQVACQTALKVIESLQAKLK